MVPRRWLMLFSALGAAGVVWCGVLIIGLLIGAPPLPTSVAVGVGAGLALPGAIGGLITNRLWYGSTRPRRPWALESWVPPELPRRAALVASVLFVGFWLAGISSLFGSTPKGVPAGRDDQYVVDVHGAVTVVTQDDYLRAVDYEQRFSLGALGALSVGGAILAWSAAKRQANRMHGLRNAETGGEVAVDAYMQGVRDREREMADQERKVFDRGVRARRKEREAHKH